MEDDGLDKMSTTALVHIDRSRFARYPWGMRDLYIQTNAEIIYHQKAYRKQDVVHTERLPPIVSPRTESKDHMPVRESENISAIWTPSNLRPQQHFHCLTLSGLGS